MKIDTAALRTLSRWESLSIESPSRYCWITCLISASVSRRSTGFESRPLSLLRSGAAACSSRRPRCPARLREGTGVRCAPGRNGKRRQYAVRTSIDPGGVDGEKGAIRIGPPDPRRADRVPPCRGAVRLGLESRRDLVSELSGSRLRHRQSERGTSESPNGCRAPTGGARRHASHDACCRCCPRRSTDSPRLLRPRPRRALRRRPTMRCRAPGRG